MKRTRVEEQNDSLPIAFLDILEANLYHIILSLRDFLAWHATCRHLNHFLVDGILGRYTQIFCKEAMRENEVLLRERKNSLYFQNLVQLNYMKQIADAVDSIMGPIVYDHNTLKTNVIGSCLLEAIGYSEKSTFNDKMKLYQILVKCREFIRANYGWELGIIREKRAFFLPEKNKLDTLTYKDYCALSFPVEPKPQQKPVGDPIICILF